VRAAIIGYFGCLERRPIATLAVAAKRVAPVASPWFTTHTEFRIARMPDSTHTLLVVEDDDIVRMLIVDVLEELDYKVLEAADGAQAMAILAQSETHLDMMMTDVGLPDINGRDLALKARELRASLPVLFASGYADNVDVPAGMHSIGKPFSIDQLRDKVKSILG
jgi:CheY-like chemotaxis protein